MNTLVHQIHEHGLTNRIFTSRQLSDIFEGNQSRRNRLVSHALKAGVLVRLKRGVYCLSTSITGAEFLPHPFGVAQVMDMQSYISFETALRFHNWIPEAVYTHCSVTPKPKSFRYLHNVLGWFSFQPLAVNKNDFLKGVSHYQFGEQSALVADPLRAVMDIVERQKQVWTDIDYIEEGLRIEDEDFLKLRRKDFAMLKNVYKHRKAVNFLENFEVALFKLKSQT